MARVEILLSVGSNNLLHLIHSIYMMGEGEELTSLFSDVALAYFFFRYGLIGIQLYDSLWMMSPERNFGSNHVAFGGIIFPLSAMSMICCMETG